MGRIGVSKAEWDSAVTAGANSVSSVSGVTVKSLEKTNLKPFQALILQQRRQATTLTSYKGYNLVSTNKMKEVAQKIVDEDAQFGANFDKNTANLRFK